jgi:hypothetical protein
MDAIHIKQCEMEDCDNQAIHFTPSSITLAKGIVVKTTGLCAVHASRGDHQI